MKRLHSAAILVAYSLLTFIMTWPLGQNMTTAIPGDGFDGWQNYWNLWWIKVALVDKLQHPFYTDILYAPTGVGLYFHTLNPFNGLVTLPIQLSAGLIPAYNAVVLISWVLGGYGTYLLTLWILKKNIRYPSSTARYPAFLAGVIFTFAPFHMAHLLGHMQVMSLQWIPFYVLYLLRALDCAEERTVVDVQKPSLPKKTRFLGVWQREACFASLFLILTGLCDWYFVLYLFLFTGFVMVWRCLSSLREGNNIRQTVSSIVTPPAMIGLIFCVVMSPLLMPMALQVLRYDFMVRPATDLYILSASLMDFLVPNRLHTWFRPESFGWIGNQIAPASERTISLGYVPLLLATIALWTNRRRSIFWLSVMLFFIVLALGPRIHLGNIGWPEIPADADAALVQSKTPFTLLNQFIPLMRISRSVSRYALMAQLALAVLAGLGFAAILSYMTRNRFINSEYKNRVFSGKLGFSAVIFLLILAEYWVAPYPLSPPDTPGFYKQLSLSPSSLSTLHHPLPTILNLPMNYDRPGYLLYQTVHQRPLAVAYISRDDPRTLTERVPILQHFRHLGPDIIPVNRYKMPNLESQERQYTTELAQVIFADREPIYEDDRLTVFEVNKPDEPQPYVILGTGNWGPLQIVNEETDQVERSRVLPDGWTWLDIYHGNSDTQLVLRYRTPPNVKIRVIDPVSFLLIATLPPAPTAHEISIDVGILPNIILEPYDIEASGSENQRVIIEEIRVK